MNSNERAFNRTLQDFLKSQPNSLASKTIVMIQEAFPGHQSLYSLFDSFAFKIGIGIIASPVDLPDSETVAKYLPYLKYYPHNQIGEEPKEIQLCNELPLSDCYSFLAKELLYRIMRIPNLDELIAKR